jgi:hypothetical protein
MPANDTWTEWNLLQQLRSTPQIWERLAAMSGSELHVQAALRREFPDPLVRAALTLADCRHRAQAKFSHPENLWCDRQSLEQATAEPVARHKAARFTGRVWDFCSGLGSDAIALAEHCETIAVDIEPAMCLRAKWNAESLPASARPVIVCADVQTITDRSGRVHIDPDRRPSGSPRVVRIEDYVPGLDLLTRLTEEFSGGAIKLSPAANFGGKFPGSEIELISLHGECKEATVWFGDLARPEPWRATVLPSGETLAGDPLDAFAELGLLGRYLYDPDPAVVRAGLVDLCAQELGLARLDKEEEYLTGDEVVSSAFVRGFEVVAELPNNPRAIRSYFRDSDVGQLEIKCRHIRVQIEALRKQLTLPGDTPAVLIFARIGGKARAVVCRRVT